MNRFESVPVKGENVDKYVHATFYFVFTFFWFGYIKYKRALSLNKQLLYVFTGAVLYGILMEICQGLFTNDRSADLKDVVANTSGSAIAILLFWLINRQKK
ncbi:hypothetical protein GR160_13725 [Flavobacterium sp. Sd200]|uniref:VanZ family protein n=1 Tax=Flavobacterium sp. Sd200 TaxID=2692211 RepID=UPI0013692A6A|nr:VanZ family protein [Flavobacterium sp. Sd200]MXN92284.1 hypothetical protein [Flavobacterium sp. Sd200]